MIKTVLSAFQEQITALRGSERERERERALSLVGLYSMSRTLVLRLRVDNIKATFRSTAYFLVSFELPCLQTRLGYVRNDV
jgi:hypothetical protein